MYVKTTRGFEERQQPPAFTPDDPRLRTAADRESHGLGQSPTAQVAGGEFGRALASIDVPAVATNLLRQSSTFMDMARALDKRYIYLWHPTEKRHRRLTTSANGVVTTGSFVGRRVLDVKTTNAGSWFEPYTSPDNTGYYDVIWIERSGRGNTGRWIERIAHEVTHAFHLATRAAAPAAKLVDRVRAAITEEIETRQVEALVLAEILRTPEGARELQGFTPNAGSTARHDVERDFFPVSRRTYLEHFMLSELAREAIKREGLSDTERKAKNLEVAAIPIKGWRARKFSSDYAKLRFWLRVIHFRWERLDAIHGSNPAAFDRGREIVLQEHVNAFFGGLLSYTPRPTRTRAPTAQPRPTSPRPASPRP